MAIGECLVKRLSLSLPHYEFLPLLIYTIAKQLKRLIKSAHVTRERGKTTQGTQTTTTRSYTTDQPQRVYEYSLESTVAHNNTLHLLLELNTSKLNKGGF